MVSQIDLISAISTCLEKHGVKELVPRQFNAIINAANEIIAECERKPVMTSDGMGLMRWLASDDVGLSSRYMASVLDGGFVAEYAHPHDADDFGRCVRLLVAVPELRGRLDEMWSKSDEWSRLIACWADAEIAINAKNYTEANRLVVNAIKST